MLTFSRIELLELPVAMRKSLFIVLAFALVCCGCSTASLVYHNADWYLQHKINGYTSFNAQQKKLILHDVSDYMHWHRKNALPEYIISSWILIPEASRLPRQQRVIESFETASDEMIARIQGLLTAAQKEHVHKMISSYIDDMRAEIAGSGKESGR